MKLEILEFIKNNGDWENMIAQPPYSIKVTRDCLFGMNLVMLKYSQLESDFNIKMVRECRGIVFNEDTWEVVSYSFDKFGNIQESYVPVLDKNSMKTHAKIDGSLCKVVRIGDELLFSTNGTIDAFKAPVAEQIGCKYKSFGEIMSEVFYERFKTRNLDWKDYVKEGFTYSFEMVSPFCKVVIPYKENNLFLIGIRNNKTYEELYFGDSELNGIFESPKEYDFGSLDACIDNAHRLPWDEEGYVVMDGNFDRVKVKSLNWLTAHHLHNNGVLSYYNVIELIRKNETEEILSYFPEFQAPINEVRGKIDGLLGVISDKLNVLSGIKDGFGSRKEAAQWIMKNLGKHSGIGFAYLDNKIKDVKDWYDSVPTSRLQEMLEK